MQPTIDESAAHLSATGWSAGDAAFDDSRGRVWLVFCHRRGRVVKGEGPTQASAWRDASEKAQACDN